MFQEISGIRQVIGNVFLVFPNYCLGNGLMEIAQNHYRNEFYSHTGKSDQKGNPEYIEIHKQNLYILPLIL